MFTVYILKNNITSRHYIGYTKSLLRRLKEHNNHQNKSTKIVGRWEIVHKEVFKTLSEAIKRERLIKSYKGGNAFKELMRR